MDHKSRIDDNDILDYLMTSDFNDGYSIDESRLLLLKFRQFYRTLQSNNESLKHIINSDKKDIESLNDKLDKVISESQSKIDELNGILNTIKNKKLSIIERIKGKINIKYDTK